MPTAVDKCKGSNWGCIVFPGAGATVYSSLA